MKPLFTLLAVLALLALSPITVRVAAAATTLTITLSASNVTFPDQDPDLFAVSPQTGMPLQITITTKQVGAGTPYSCTALALGDLTSGPATIPIANITWSAVTITSDAGESFYNGTLSRTTAVMVAKGIGNDARKSPLTGDLTFSIQNLWTYAIGNYSQSVNFTVSAP
jgi:hypothetical protein